MESRRLFLAVHLTDELRSRLAEVQRALADHSDAVRLVAEENLHLTLHFLGDTAEDRVEPVLQAMRSTLSRFSPFETRARGGGCFPSPRKPRVFWAGVDGAAGELGSLYATLGEALASLDFEIDERPFSPHITIGYARKRAPRSDLSAALADLADAAQTRLGAEGTRLPVSEVALVESVLGRGGPSYSDVGRVTL